MTRGKKILLTAFGILFSVLPPLLATLLYFPVFERQGPAFAISGFIIILLILSAVPLIRFLGDKFRTPAAYLIWLFVFLLFFALWKIAKQVTVISFFGFVGNLVGAILFHIAKKDSSEGANEEN